MDILRRELSPIIDGAWEQIEQEARRILRANLSARKVVDVEGPKGWDAAAVNLGRLGDTKTTDDGVNYGIRRVLPLVEFRIPFRLGMWELDNVARGAEDPDLRPLLGAAQKAAQFEERAIYHGFAPGGIVGMAEASDHPPVELGSNALTYPEKIATALLTLQDAGVEGPYQLVLGPEPFRHLAGDTSAYPPRQQIAKIIGTEAVYSPGLDGGFLISTRGGDFELTLGQDLSIGYAHHDPNEIELFITESFTFRAVGPEAVVWLQRTR